MQMDALIFRVKSAANQIVLRESTLFKKPFLGKCIIFLAMRSIVWVIVEEVEVVEGVEFS
jgi:hypothetical protein